MEKEGGIPFKAIPVVSIIVGITLWTWQAYVFGSLHIRWASYIYLIIFLAFFAKNYLRSFKKIVLPSFGSLDPVLIFLGIIGVLAQTFQYYDFGLKTKQGVIITSYNSADHIWHASLVRELITRFPLNEPGLAGVPLKDYHYWFNLCTADLIRVFHLPILQTQFIGMYLLASILLGFIGYFLAKSLYDNKTFLRLFLFFLFFAGDASMWVLLIFRGNFDLTLSSIVNNAAKFIDSPAYSYSMIVALACLYLAFLFRKEASKRYIMLMALMFGSLFEFKVYTAIVFLAGLGLLALLELLKKRTSILFTFILSCILGAIIFLPGLSSASELFYLPFAMPRDFLTQKIFGLLDWQLRWQIYADHNNYLRLYEYGIFMSIIYCVCQFGIQLVGVLPTRNVRRILGFEKLLPLYAIILTAFIIGLQFYQAIGGANIWEFFLPAEIILSLLTALIIATYLEGKSKVLRWLIFASLFIIIIPRWAATVSEGIKTEYLSGFHGLTNAEYVSYQYIENNIPYSQAVLAINNKYVAQASLLKVITGRDFYLSGEGARQQKTPEIIKRENIVKQIKSGKLQNESPLLKKAGVYYIYIAGNTDFLPLPDATYQVIFHNNAATIIKLL